MQISGTAEKKQMAYRMQSARFEQCESDVCVVNLKVEEGCTNNAT
jgi:hypothetical protein